MIDLSRDQLAIVRDILGRHVPSFEVRAFGSRVTGKARNFSDLDLAIVSDKPLNFALLGRIRDAFSESDLPFKVDVLDWSTISAEFKEIINSSYAVIQEGTGRSGSSWLNSSKCSL